MDAHREHRGEHQRNAREDNARAADHHDADFDRLDDPDQPRLIVVIGKLPRERGEQEERQYEQRLRDSAELKLLMGVGEQLIGDEQDDRLLKEAVVERSQELRRKERQESSRAEQVSDVLDQEIRAPDRMGLRPAA